MKTIRLLFICLVFALSHANMSFALENSNNSGELNENTIKNFTYRMEFTGQAVTLINGEYKSLLRPGNKEDMSKYIHVKLEKYVIGNSSIRNQPIAIVILSENAGSSGTFFQITALIKEKDKIIQTNSIMLGDRVVIKNLRFQEGYKTFQGSRRDEILVSILTQKDNDPSCCPSHREIKCFNLVKDHNNEIKLFACKEAEEVYPLPVVKKPAIYLYPEKPQKVEILLKPKGTLTKTIPEYHDKWIVTANPNGVINGKYPYLFYEVELTEQVKLPEQGWMVPKNDMEKWFDEFLPKLGLNNKETKDFKDYWLAQLKQYPYYKIKSLDGDFVNENLKIQIKPKPETIIRVILYFEGTYNDLEKVANPVIETPARQGFTIVEWGGILKDSDKSDVKPVEYSFFPAEKGIIVLRSINIENYKLLLRVNTNGCTDKKSIKVDIRKTAGIDVRVPNYEITFIREKSDYCKALLPEGVLIEYDIKKEFQIDMPYTLKINNPIMPFTENEPYFMIGEIKQEIEEVQVQEEENESIVEAIKDAIVEIKKDIKNATIYAINREIKRYENRGETEKVTQLKKDLEEIQKFKDENFPVPENLENSSPESLLNEKTFCPIIPCKAREVEIIWDKKYSIGDILNVKGMTKSGPFYHIAGIRDEVKNKLKEGGIYKATICLVYKREYFGFIPDYYVYITDIKKD